MQVRVDASELFPALPGSAELQAQLEAKLMAILKDYEIPFEAQQECSGNRFLLSRFTGEPSDFAGDTTYVFEAVTRVGLATLVLQQDDGAAIPASSLYEAYASWLLFEDELTEPELFLPVANEQMMRDLATDWWEDNPVINRSFPWVQLAGIAVTVLIVGVGIYLYRRTSHRES